MEEKEAKTRLEKLKSDRIAIAEEIQKLQNALRQYESNLIGVNHRINEYETEILKPKKEVKDEKDKNK